MLSGFPDKSVYIQQASSTGLCTHIDAYYNKLRKTLDMDIALLFFVSFVPFDSKRLKSQQSNWQQIAH